MNDWLTTTRESYDNIAREYAEFEILKVHEHPPHPDVEYPSHRVSIFAKTP